jgi:hypothetical protein
MFASIERKMNLWQILLVCVARALLMVISVEEGLVRVVAA